MWQEHLITDEGQKIYARVDDDGLIRVTAVRGYPELEEYLEALENDSEASE